MPEPATTALLAALAGRDTFPAGAVFDATQWSVLLATRSDAADRPAARQSLCSAYWRPI